MPELIQRYEAVSHPPQTQHASAFIVPFVGRNMFLHFESAGFSQVTVASGMPRFLVEYLSYAILRPPEGAF